MLDVLIVELNSSPAGCRDAATLQTPRGLAAAAGGAEVEQRLARLEEQVAENHTVQDGLLEDMHGDLEEMWAQLAAQQRQLDQLARCPTGWAPVQQLRHVGGRDEAAAESIALLRRGLDAQAQRFQLELQQLAAEGAAAAALAGTTATEQAAAGRRLDAVAAGLRDELAGAERRQDRRLQQVSGQVAAAAAAAATAATAAAPSIRLCRAGTASMPVAETPVAKEEATAVSEERMVFRAECDALFQQTDKNGDGRLTKKEIKVGLTAIKAKTGLVQTAKDVWKAADADGSKAVDRDEFFAFMERKLREQAGEAECRRRASGGGSDRKQQLQQRGSPTVSERAAAIAAAEPGVGLKSVVSRLKTPGVSIFLSHSPESCFSVPP